MQSPPPHNALVHEHQLRFTVFQILLWILLGIAVGALCGSASGIFLWWLDSVTRARGANPNLIFFLPLAGLLLGQMLATWGLNILGGNNLILDTLNDDAAPRLPRRMTPLVLIGSLLTHLFGGSAGREGTAVQMGGSLADALARLLNLHGNARKQLISAGIAGGFGAVFGTPFAGAVFGVEVVRMGRIEYHALVPALVSALTGDWVARAILHGVNLAHTPYPSVNAVAFTPLTALKLLALAAACAAASALFVELMHAFKSLLKRRVASMPLRLFLGGCVVVLLWQIAGTDQYLGLSIPLLVDSFKEPALPLAAAAVPAFAFLWKIVFSAVTLGSGFLGGEVTPLFCIGATLGNSLSGPLGLPVSLAAACGFAAVFGACANTPLACAIMAVELFGGNVLPHAALVCVFAYLLTGHRGIYPSQRLAFTKLGQALDGPQKLEDFR